MRRILLAWWYLLLVAVMAIAALNAVRAAADAAAEIGKLFALLLIVVAGIVARWTFDPDAPEAWRQIRWDCHRMRLAWDDQDDPGEHPPEWFE